MKNQVVFNIVCHTNSRLERNARGDIDLPFYDRQLAGGNMWGNKCDNIICYHRPYFRSDPTSNIAIMDSQKVKNQRQGGKRGSKELEFDIKSLRFSVVGGEEQDFEKMGAEVRNAPLEFRPREMAEVLF